MRRLGIVAVGLALVAGVLAGSWSAVVRAQPVATIALPAPRGTVQLYSGCNNIALTFPDGTASQTVVQAVTPAGVVEAMWRHNAAQNRFEGFSPAAPQASDLLAVNLWDAVWLCVAAAPAAAAPSPAPPPPAQPPAFPPSVCGGPPTYCDVVATYPPGTAQCMTDVEVSGNPTDGYWTDGLLDTGTGLITGQKFVTGEEQKWLRCHGAKLEVMSGQTATFDGVTYGSDEKLTVDKDLRYVQICTTHPISCPW
jgi:hypothetical protein